MNIKTSACKNALQSIGIFIENCGDTSTLKELSIISNFDYSVKSTLVGDKMVDVVDLYCNGNRTYQVLKSRPVTPEDIKNTFDKVTEEISGSLTKMNKDLKSVGDTKEKTIKVMKNTNK